ncbi:cation:proton antiporter [Streptomyces flavochromogenes]|uniref:cation:proton antiporter domain-containing protein n=1 Tax=Streptomyces flavochromogenes TaxID=68199 RepID=UPI00068ED249|nr:cation:proton antiporter [Streptomyces flavochromogenes]
MLAGTVLGYLGAFLMRRALESGRARPAGLRVSAPALPFLAYAASVLIDGNGFVAASVAGLWFAGTASELGEHTLDLVYDISHLLALAVWFTFGTVVAEEFSNGITPQVVGYAALVLTVARLVPVAAALTGTVFTWAERGAVGRLGSRGVTSIVFATLAYTQLQGDDAAFVVNATAATVLLSVILHGLTAEPVARWFARNPQPGTPPVPAPPTPAEPSPAEPAP